MTPHANYPLQSAGFVTFDQVLTTVKEHIEIVALILLFLGYQSYNHFEKEIVADIIAEPRKSDFYYVDYTKIVQDYDDPRFRYLPLKIVEVGQETLTFKVGNIGHSEPVSPRKHMMFDQAVTIRSFYKQNTITLPKSEVIQLYQSGAIYSARRPKSIFIHGWIAIPRHEMYVDSD